jgi:superfamily II DNA or RNA helicase
MGAQSALAGSLIGQRHGKELLKQWIERLRQFLSVGVDDIGTIGGGRRKPMGRIDVALIQSLVRTGGRV